MQTVLTIAGFDPSSGAGVTADLMVFAAHSLFGTACITALTVQSTLGVRSTHPVGAAVVEATLDCLHADLLPAGIKIGMVSDATNIFIISEFLARHRAMHQTSLERPIPVVLDPVLRSSSGRELLDQQGIAALRERLLPMVDWVTPNLDELAILSGDEIEGRDAIPNACNRLQALVESRDGQALGIIATGGHLDPPDDYVLTPEGESLWLPGERIVTQSTHGTGCAFSSAFLSRLVLGDTAFEAARGAKEYVAEAMRTAEEYGAGRSPLNYLWPFHQPKSYG
jgi:hydroxymethylpyrimidine/phosphomethylpyrimidine kinase